MTTRVDARQSIVRDSLGQLTGASNSELDDIATAANNQLAKLFEDRNVMLTGGGTITNTGGTSLSFSSNFVLYVNSNIAGAAPYTVSIGFSPWAFGTDGDMAYIVVTSRSAGTFALTTDAATLPAVNSANQEVFMIAKRVGTRIFLMNGQSLGSGESASLGSASVTPSFSDAVFQITDDADPTKIVMFQVSGITTATTRTFTLPNTSDTLSVLGTAQTFSAEQTYSAQMRISDGSVTEPSIVFTSDDDATGTGIYRVGVNSIGLTTNGANTWTVASTGAHTWGPAAGGVANSLRGSLDFTVGNNAGTPTYGMNRNSSNALDLFTNSALGLSIDSSQTVTIGPAAGAVVNTVRGALGFTVASNTGTPTYGFNRNASNALDLFTNSTLAGSISNSQIWSIGPAAGAVAHNLNGSLNFNVASASGPPTYGLNRNASNAIDFFTNSTLAGSISSSQAWSIGPAAGAVLHNLRGSLSFGVGSGTGTPTYGFNRNASNDMEFYGNSSVFGTYNSSGSLTWGTATDGASHQFTSANVTGTTCTLRASNTSIAAGSSDNAPLEVVKGVNDASGSSILVRFFINSSTGSGAIAANGASNAQFVSFSDINLKENIINISGSLNKIMALRPVEFDYKDGCGHQTGFVAQEMEEVFPEDVGTMDGFKTIVGWSKQSAHLVKAIQELKNELDEYKLSHP